MGIRFRIDPGDVPPAHAARRLGLSLSEFEKKLPALLERGFPGADETTGNYDLDAIDAWRKRRHPDLTDPGRARNAQAVVLDRLGKRPSG